MNLGLAKVSTLVYYKAPTFQYFRVHLIDCLFPQKCWCWKNGIRVGAEAKAGRQGGVLGKQDPGCPELLQRPERAPCRIQLTRP